MNDITKILLIKQLPAISELLEYASLKYYIQAYSKERVEVKLTETIETIKTQIDQGTIKSVNTEEIIFATINKLSNEFSLNLKPVINATGIVLNQYLGRSPLPEEVISHIANTTIGYCNLDYNIDKGTCHNRLALLTQLLNTITGAEASVIVNNNAAALLLIANTFAQNKDIIISRGEIVEMEGEFRLTDIIKLANSNLVEVGTTNRSHLKDYSSALTDKSSMILKVHTSSYYIKGYTSKVELFALVELAGSKNILCVEDLGTGLLIDLNKYGLPYEPTIKQVLKTGVDLITFSGDKLLGGPQAGIILGKKHLVDALLNNPLIRTLRPDKLTLSALEAVLHFYLNPEHALESIPTLRMLTKPVSEIESDAYMLYEDLRHFHSIDCGVKKAFSEIGGAILPEVKLPTYTVWIKHKILDSCSLHQKFLSNSVVTLIKEDKILIDPRCLVQRDFKILGMVFEQVLKSISTGEHF